MTRPSRPWKNPAASSFATLGLQTFEPWCTFAPCFVTFTGVSGSSWWQWTTVLNSFVTLVSKNRSKWMISKRSSQVFFLTAWFFATLQVLNEDEAALIKADDTSQKRLPLFYSVELGANPQHAKNAIKNSGSPFDQALHAKRSEYLRRMSPFSIALPFLLILKCLLIL